MEPMQQDDIIILCVFSFVVEAELLYLSGGMPAGEHFDCYFPIRWINPNFPNQIWWSLEFAFSLPSKWLIRWHKQPISVRNAAREGIHWNKLFHSTAVSARQCYLQNSVQRRSLVKASKQKSEALGITLDAEKTERSWMEFCLGKLQVFSTPSPFSRRWFLRAGCFRHRRPLAKRNFTPGKAHMKDSDS